MMRKLFRYATIIALVALLAFSVALADSVEEHLKNLKHEDADVRAKAAYELGCG
jgi:hypothetical protein